MLGNAVLTKNGWLILEEPLKPLETYSRADRPMNASIKRLSELTGIQPGKQLQLVFRNGTIAGITCSRTERLALSEDIRTCLNLEKSFTGRTMARITDNYGFTGDSGNRAALMQQVRCWQQEEAA